MSEKRFKFVKALGFTNLLKKDVFIKDRENDYYIRFVEEVVDLLNELNDEKEQLRFLVDINSVSERTKLERQVDEQQATINALKEENEQLRKEHQEMLEKYVLLKLKIGEVLNDE